MLVFLLLLGYLCEGLSIECENFVEELSKIIGMEVGVVRPTSILESIALVN
jgi:hypothetical protein